MDIIDELEFTYEEQCTLQLEKLKTELLEESQNDKEERNSTVHRLFKHNVFDYIEPRRMQYLKKVLRHILKKLGDQINSNLVETARQNRTATLTTPSPLSISSRSSIQSPITRSRSISSDSYVSKSEPEVIFISSDEESEDKSVLDEVKVEPPYADVNLRDISNRLNCERIDSESPKKVPDSTLPIVSRGNASNYRYNRFGVINLKSRKEIKFKQIGAVNQAFLLHLIVKILKLLETGCYVTKRELYYHSLKFCKKMRKPRPVPGNSISQRTETQVSSLHSTEVNGQKYDTKKLDSAIDDLCCLVGCSKLHLHIIAQPKGLIYGNLSFKMKTGELIDCLSKKEGTLIPNGQMSIIEMQSTAKCILVVEKDAVLQKILNQEAATNFVERYNLILFTGRGYPDVTSRAFLNFMWSKLKIPVLALADADPYGFEIVCSYKFGCYATAYESSYLVVPQIKWLGLLPSDIIKLSIPDSKTEPLSTHDMRKLESLLNRPYLKERESWNEQLNIMKKHGRKAELESLDVDGGYLVTTFLPNKLRFASWL